MRSRRVIYRGVTALAVVLLLTIGITIWKGPAISFAADSGPATTQPVASVDVKPAPMTAAQQQVGGVMPTQQVLSQLYDQVSPSVVNIQVTMDAQASGGSQLPLPGFPFDPFGNPGSAAPAQAEGTGWVFDNQGHIVTNNHVVENTSSIVVYFSNGMWADATVVATDPQADLAVIKVTPPDGMELHPLTLAATDSLRVGYYVAAIGSPFGLDETMTLGIVSALGRSFRGDSTNGASYTLPDVIQTDAAINPGNSGGPLLDMQGEVVGVNFAINSPVRANSGVGFAIPVAVIEKVVPALIQSGAYQYSYVGIAGQTITADVAQQGKLQTHSPGVLVGQVVAGGPADKAGLQEGDIITAIGDKRVASFDDLIGYLFVNTSPGDKVTLHIVRNGNEQTVDVTLGTAPNRDEGADPGAIAEWGDSPDHDWQGHPDGEAGRGRCRTHDDHRLRQGRTAE